MTTEALETRTPEDGVESVEVIEGAAAVTLAAVDRAAIDAQVATAKQYPRSITRALEEARTLATMDEDTAAACFYVLPRSGKKIEGPSVRLAEIMVYSWGNLRADADIVDDDGKYVTAMGTCFDLEKNVAVRVRVRRRVTDSKGRRYNDDMIGVASNAAISIALRNAVFKVIPGAYTRRVYQDARRASLGEGGTITQKRQLALEWLAKAGLSEAQVCEILDVEGVDDVLEEELITLKGLMTAIRDGDTSVEELLRGTRGAPSAETAALNDALRGKPAEESEDADEKPGPGKWHLQGCPSGYGLWAAQTPSGGWYYPAICRNPEKEPAGDDYIAHDDEGNPKQLQRAAAFEAIQAHKESGGQEGLGLDE